MNGFDRKRKIVIGMAQPEALPGSYLNDGKGIQQIEDELLEEVSVYQKYGYDSIILQNYEDIPVHSDSSIEAVAYMARLSASVKREFPKLLIGLLMVWDGCASLAVADAVGADYVRVEHCYSGAEMTATGIITAQCTKILSLKKKLGSKIPVYADVFEPHAIPVLPQPIDVACASAINECRADGLFVCGKSPQESLEMGKSIRKRLPNTPLILGGGATGDNICGLLSTYDGVCVGTWIKDGSLSNPINPERVKYFMEQVRKAENKE